MEEQPKMSYAQKLVEKRARVRIKERGLWEAYSMELLTPDEMRARLRKLATEQVEALPSESYH